MMHIKSRKIKDRRVLYIRYFKDGKEVTKSTGLEDTPKNRKYVKLTVIPALKVKLKVKEAKERIERESFGYFAKEYLREKDSLKTFWEINSRVNRLIDFFGEKTPIIAITATEIRGFISSFKSSPKTLKHYISDLRQILQLAIYDEIIDVNPVSRVKLPKHTKREISPFSDEDIERLMSEARGDVLAYLGIAFNTGMRSGEIIGLQIGDIDLESGYIRVTRSISKGVVSTPKTLSSIRDVPILPDAQKYLLMQIDKARRKQTNWLFSKADGKHLYGVDALSIRRLLKRLGINNRVYDTRHTFIVKMLNSGKIKVMDLAKIVGHTNPQMILTTYAKHIEGEKIRIDFEIKIT